MSALCLLGGGVVVRIAATAFTLGWTHSIEKIPIEDDWIVADGRLLPVESRIKGSGAGIEPGDGARLVDGWYRWAPPGGGRAELVLRRSGAAGTGDWTVCAAGICRTLGEMMPAAADPVVIRPCDDAGLPPG